MRLNEILHNRYEITRAVTAGGMGSVYEAYDRNLQGPCAVKEMHETSDAWVHRRFREEATLLSRLNHPSIPRVRDFFLEGNQGYIVMDFVKGRNLTQEVKGRLKDVPRRLEAQEAIRVGLTVLDVLDYLHGLTPAVLHRDIKPSNIIREEATGNFKLVDFGLARPLVDAAQTCAGTVNFSAPEQLEGRAEIRSDIYSVGATLFFLVSGQPPPVGVSKPILFLVPDLDVKLAQVIDRALEQKPENRFASAREMAQALTSQPARPLLSRPRLLAAAAVLVALLGFGVARAYLPPPPNQVVPGAPQIVETAPLATLSVTEEVAQADLDKAHARLRQRVRAYAQQHKTQLGPGYVRYHNWRPPQPVKLEVGFVVTSPDPGDAEVVAGNLPGGRVAMLVYAGPYEELQQRFTYLRRWLDSRQLQPGEGAWAVYRVTAATEPDPTGWITEVYWPLTEGSATP